MKGDPRIEELRRLVSSPEGPRRLFGFLRLEERLDDLPADEVLKLLDQAESDPEPQVLQVARRVGQALALLRRRRRFPGGGRTVFEAAAEPLPHEVDELGAIPCDAFRDAAEVLLGPAMDQLQTCLESGKPGVVRRALLTVAELRHPRFLAALEDLAAEDELAVPLVEAARAWGHPRARELLRELASGDRAARLLALDAISADAEGDHEAYGLLELAAKDPSPTVRAAAAGGLGQEGSDKSIRLLRQLLDDAEVEVQRAAVDGWARQRDPGAVQVLLEMLQYRVEDPGLKASILAALRDLRSPAAQDLLETLVRDPDPRVRANAVEALGAYEHSFQRAMRLFRPLLSDDAARVRGNAVLALFLAHPPSATDALLELFDSSEAPLRKAAAYCAGMIQSKRATEKLELMMRTEQDMQVLETCLRALGRIRGPEAIRILRAFTERSYGEICVKAVQLLAELGDSSAVPTLVRLAREAEEPGLRAAAVQGIAELAGDQGSNYLPRFLGDRDHRVVANAIEGLEASGTLEAIPLLQPLLDSPVHRIRANAAVALWHLGEFAALRTIEAMLTSDDEAELASGLYGLGAVGASLKVANLGGKPVLKLALAEAYRRAFHQALELGDEHDLAASRADLTTSQTKETVDLTGLFAAVPADGSALPEGAASPPAPGTPPGPGGALEVVVEAADGAGSAPPPDLEPAAPPPETARARAQDDARDAAAVRTADALFRGESGEAARQQFAEHPDQDAFWLLALREAQGAGDQRAMGRVARATRDHDSTFLTPLYAAARARRRGGDLAESMRLYFRIARAQLAELTALAEAGEAALAEDDLDAAGAVGRLLPTMMPFLPRFHAVLGDLYMSRREYSVARRHLLRAFLAFPEDAVLALKLASAALREGAPQLARAAAEAARGRDPGGAMGRKAEALLARLEDQEAGT